MEAESAREGQAQARELVDAYYSLFDPSADAGAALDRVLTTDWVNRSSACGALERESYVWLVRGLQAAAHHHA